MTLRTVGTNGTASLSAFVVGFNDLIPADVASLITALRADPSGYESRKHVAASGLVDGTSTVRPRLNQSYVQTGLLIVPRRGTLRLQAGDVVAWDTTVGWPIVISGDAFANGPYSHT